MARIGNTTPQLDQAYSASHFGLDRISPLGHGFLAQAADPSRVLGYSRPEGNVLTRGRVSDDSETMGDWLGMPKNQDLPSTFSVDYIRAWKKDATRGQCRNTFSPSLDPTMPTAITHDVRKMTEKRW